MSEKFPFMIGMPKSTLTVEELELVEYVIRLKYDVDLWRRAMAGETLDSLTDRQSFYELGVLVFGQEGFNDLWQSVEISQRVQTLIDTNARNFP